MNSITLGLIISGLMTFIFLLHEVWQYYKYFNIMTKANRHHFRSHIVITLVILLTFLLVITYDNYGLMIVVSVGYLMQHFFKENLRLKKPNGSFMKETKDV